MSFIKRISSAIVFIPRKLVEFISRKGVESAIKQNHSQNYVKYSDFVVEDEDWKEKIYCGKRYDTPCQCLYHSIPFLPLRPTKFRVFYWALKMVASAFISKYLRRKS